MYGAANTVNNGTRLEQLAASSRSDSRYSGQTDPVRLRGKSTRKKKQNKKTKGAALESRFSCFILFLTRSLLLDFLFKFFFFCRVFPCFAGEKSVERALVRDGPRSLCSHAGPLFTPPMRSRCVSFGKRDGKKLSKKNKGKKKHGR